jgi:hypothetical protein
LTLVRRLTVHYPDAVIAGILNRQKRTTARGLRFTANLVGNLRRHWQISRFEPAPAHPEGELVSIQHAAKILDMAPSTLHRWVNDGFVAGEQITPGAPWQIRLTDELRQRFVTPQLLPATWPCKRRPGFSGCPAKPCCNVSSAANWKRSTSARDAEKAYESK